MKYVDAIRLSPIKKAYRLNQHGQKVFGGSGGQLRVMAFNGKMTRELCFGWAKDDQTGKRYPVFEENTTGEDWRPM